MTTFERLADIVRQGMPNPDIEITTETDLFSELGLNSFDLVQLITDVEIEFGLKEPVPDEEFRDLRVMKNLVAYLDEHTQ